MCILFEEMKLLIYFIVFSYFPLLLTLQFEDFEVDLKLKHKINETTFISQETLQKILTGADKGDKGSFHFLSLFPF